MNKDVSGLDINLRAVSAFVTVMEEGHFGRAAASLFVTAPALSQQIRRLEQSLGFRLIKRDSHPLTLTAAGVAFMPHACRLIESAQEAAFDLTRFARSRDHTLRVGFIAGGTQHATSLLRRLSNRIELKQLSWPEQLTAVANGMVDASFVIPPIPLVDGLTLEPIGTEPRVVAVHREHPLVGRASVSINDLDDDEHVGADHMTSDWMNWWAVDPRPSGRPVRYGPIIHTMDEELQLVATGRAIAITTTSIASYYAGADVEFIPVRDIEPCVIMLCTRTGDDHPGVRELRRASAALVI